MTCAQSFTGIEENIGTVDVDVEHPHDVSDDRMETEHSSGKRTLMQKSCVKQNHWQKRTPKIQLSIISKTVEIITILHFSSEDWFSFLRSE